MFPPERKPERGYIRVFPRNENRNEGTFACSPGTKKPERGHSRQNHPFGKPSFSQPPKIRKFIKKLATIILEENIQGFSHYFRDVVTIVREISHYCQGSSPLSSNSKHFSCNFSKYGSRIRMIPKQGGERRKWPKQRRRSTVFQKGVQNPTSMTVLCPNLRQTSKVTLHEPQNDSNVTFRVMLIKIIFPPPTPKSADFTS